jgi:hypothetical protein
VSGSLKIADLEIGLPPIWIGTSAIESQVLLTGLQDAITGEFVNDATVTLTIKNPDGTPVSSLTLDPAGGYWIHRGGNYLAVIPDSLKPFLVTRSRPYTMELTADDAAGRVGFWRFMKDATNS